jgi:hypothetical protein
MDPYVSEVLMWLAMRIAADQKNEFIFFNDGDGKSNDQKIIGHTGGIHYTNSNKLDTVYRKVLQAKKFGCSGDRPENDFEALMDAVHRGTRKKEIILVADNLSEVRDYELLKEIEMPIHIILCGGNYMINEQYLDLAYHTKGSVHTLKEDMQMLSRHADGKSISFNGKEFVFSKGRFISK